LNRSTPSPVESDRLVYGAINGMLQTLDPHSSFMDPRTYAQMRERQEGRYYGLGVTIQVIDGDITGRAGVRGLAGAREGHPPRRRDCRIEGESTKGWTSEDAVAALRGPKDTFVNIGIRRKGLDDLLPMAVMRDEISIPSLSRCS
jgi:carboxyl-terminal processing protease